VEDDQRLRSGAATLPTADYYFLLAMGHAVAPGPVATAERPIVRLGPHVFVHQRCVLIVRYITPAELAAIRDLRPERVYYVIDDMLPIAERCHELPDGYRRRLAGFARDVMPDILALDPIIVAPSPAILALFPDLHGELLNPCALSIAPDHDHFAQAGPLRMAFLGTRSHCNGLEFIAPALRDVLGDDIRLTLFFGRHLPQDLARLPGIDNRQPLTWPAYRAFVAQERFHVLLAPLPETPFNRGRSISKLMDAAAVGAALLTSDREPFRSALTDGEGGHLLPDDPARWASAIRRLARDRQKARHLAAGAARLSGRLGDPGIAAAFWRQRLGL
jgi:glycosyltransferase involved in cell wall biosynthesis